MAGTLFGLGLSQQNDLNGKPMPGCKLYIYAAGTTTPSAVYRDSGLSLLLPWPLIADANGRLPQFWLADGAYKAILTDASNVPQFAEDNVVAIGPSSGSGGGGPAIDPTTIAQVGDMLFKPGPAVFRDGWVIGNGTTIGGTLSTATQLADDVKALALYT